MTAPTVGLTTATPATDLVGGHTVRPRRGAGIRRIFVNGKVTAGLVILFVFTLIAGGLAFLAPQIPGIAVGFAIIWALAWRRQHAAVAAIEERDGVSFYVRPTSPFHPIALQRTPGFKALRPEPTNGAVT